MDWRHLQIGGLASKWLILQSPSTGPTAPNLKVYPWMDSNHPPLSPTQQQDQPTKLCMWPPQRKCTAHATLPKCSSTSCLLQSHQWIPHTPIIIAHPSPHVIHYHWLPPTMALWQPTHHCTPTYQWWRSKCQPPLTHQQSIQWPKHHQMGPLPLRLNCISMVTSNCLLLPWETTRMFLQPSTVGKKNHWPIVDHVLHHLAMPPWRTIWKRLQRTVIYSPPNNMWQSTSHLWERQRQQQPWTHNHTALATNNRSIEVDEMPPRYIPSNSWSVPGTKHWPRLTLQASLGHNLSGCNFEDKVYGISTLRLYKSTSIIIQFSSWKSRCAIHSWMYVSEPLWVETWQIYTKSQILLLTVTQK
jgi:hypothetical protein